MKSSVITGGSMLFAIGLCFFAAANAESSGQATSLVRLQPATPGTPQTGHVNVSGTGIFGKVGVNSSGTLADLEVNGVSEIYGTSVGAGNATLHVTAFSNDLFSYGVKADSSSSGFASAAIYGRQRAVSQETYGVFGEVTGTGGGGGVYGLHSASTGIGAGVEGVTNSTDNGVLYPGVTGVMGRVTAANAGANSAGVRGLNVGTGVDCSGVIGITQGDGNGVYGVANGPNSGIGGKFQGFGPNSFGVFGDGIASSGTPIGVFGRSESPDGIGVQGWATISGGTAYGGQFRCFAPNGYGADGFASASTGTGIGMSGRSAAPGGKGIYGYASHASGAATGGLFIADSSAGVGAEGYAGSSSGSTIGVIGQSNSNAGFGVEGYASATSGTPRGVFGQSNSPTGIGCEGYNSSTASGAIGLYGQCGAPAGFAIEGYNSASSGNAVGVHALTTAPIGIGLRAESQGASGYGVFATGSTGLYGRGGFGANGEASTSAGIGVRGQALSGGTGYGVYSVGKFGASGTKSFRIDHPLDPLNKYLLHYCAEGPEVENYYNGNVTTDGKGEAWVQLPDYFDQINKDIRYTLTVVDDTDSDQFVMVKVARKVRDNRFKIKTNLPNVEVTWRVDALRNDAWVQKYGAPVEQTKQGAEKGKYQHPELYGASPEMGTSYRPGAEPAATKLKDRSEAAIHKR